MAGSIKLTFIVVVFVALVAILALPTTMAAGEAAAGKNDTAAAGGKNETSAGADAPTGDAPSSSPMMDSAAGAMSAAGAAMARGSSASPAPSPTGAATISVPSVLGCIMGSFAVGLANYHY